MIINKQTNNKMSSTCATENCSSTVSMENWSEGDAPREYCEDCYQKDQEEDEEEEQTLIDCDFCSNKEDPDEMIPLESGLACPLCRYIEDEKDM